MCDSSTTPQPYYHVLHQGIINILQRTSTGCQAYIRKKDTSKQNKIYYTVSLPHPPTSLSVTMPQFQRLEHQYSDINMVPYILAACLSASLPVRTAGARCSAHLGKRTKSLPWPAHSHHSPWISVGQLFVFFFPRQSLIIMFPRQSWALIVQVLPDVSIHSSHKWIWNFG